MKEKAQAVGEKIRAVSAWITCPCPIAMRLINLPFLCFPFDGMRSLQENGVNLAIQELYLNLDRAGTRHPPPMKKRHSLGRAGKRLSSTLIDRKQLPDVTETEDVPPTCDLAAADSEARVRAKSPIHA